MSEYWIIVDVGCIECSEETAVRGVFSNEPMAGEALIELHMEHDPENASAIVEEESDGYTKSPTIVSSFSYYSGGQHDVELHRYPPKGTPDD